MATSGACDRASTTGHFVRPQVVFSKASIPLPLRYEPLVWAKKRRRSRHDACWSMNLNMSLKISWSNERYLPLMYVHLTNAGHLDFHRIAVETLHLEDHEYEVEPSLSPWTERRERLNGLYAQLEILSYRSAPL